MPKSNATFSDKDVIRIFCEHLTEDEQISVLQAFESPKKPDEVCFAKLTSLCEDTLPLLRTARTIVLSLASVADSVLTIVEGASKLLDGLGLLNPLQPAVDGLQELTIMLIELSETLKNSVLALIIICDRR